MSRIAIRIIDSKTDDLIKETRHRSALPAARACLSTMKHLAEVYRWSGLGVQHIEIAIDGRRLDTFELASVSGEMNVRKLASDFEALLAGKRISQAA